MPTYVSLLRGINISGQKSMRMAELRELYKSLGFANIQSYLQSGNVLFQSDQEDGAELGRDIEAAIAERFGFEVSVLIRTPAEFEQVVENNPFLTTRNEDPTRLYVTFLAETPTESALAQANLPDHKPDEFVVAGQEIYIFCPNGYGRTKLSNTFFERKLKIRATTRNWKTVTALHDLATSTPS
ncbi:MAG: DUF1697 domain-containing protein [Caldilineaceae bacterium]|nr:DUF1697 domain-containing protein [Caldilineaceae bacterium]